jgi:hypothetical protein
MRGRGTPDSPQPGGGSAGEARFYGGAAELVGRAGVFANTEHTHPLDAVDILVAALFDPLSATSHIAVLDQGVDRDQLLANICDGTGRYAGVVFPLTDLHLMSGPISLPWSLRESVVRLLADLLDDSQWTYTRSKDQILVVVDADAISARLIEDLRRLDQGRRQNEQPG